MEANTNNKSSEKKYGEHWKNTIKRIELPTGNVIRTLDFVPVAKEAKALYKNIELVSILIMTCNL